MTAWQPIGIVEIERPMTLRECPPGAFIYENNGKPVLGFKTEYAEEIPAGSKLYWPGAYVMDSGEFFWGGCTNHEDRANLKVRALLFEDPPPISGAGQNEEVG